jgi:hypothetical protein
MKTLTDTCFARVAEVIWRRIGDEVVIISEDGQSTHVLNKTAAEIWEASDGSTGIAEIADRLCDRFDVSFEQASRETADFVNKLVQLGIMNPIGEAANG